MNEKIQRALVSVSDKTGLIEFCQGLTALGIDSFPPVALPKA